MTQWEVVNWLNVKDLRHAIEGCDPDFVLGFYADGARLSFVRAEVQRSITLEFCEKAEIARHLRAALGQGTSHRVEGEIIGEDRVTVRESCDYPDGVRPRPFLGCFPVLRPIVLPA